MTYDLCTLCYKVYVVVNTDVQVPFYVRVVVSRQSSHSGFNRYLLYGLRLLD